MMKVKQAASLVVAFSMLFPLNALADSAAHEKFTKHKSGSFFQPTANEKFSIEIELDEGHLKVGENSGEIVIHDSHDKDVKGAVITLSPWMPDMGHGVPEEPVVKEKEGMLGSRYLLSNLVISMGGRWEVLVEVEKDGVKDGAVFEFSVAAGDGGHKMGKMGDMKKPADMDTSSTRTSSGGMFVVSYESEPAVPPLNKIHTWRLKVRNAAGEPVRGAKIMVGGDMPEHGHGMPTKPAVTDETGEGIYLVEGMKFSMPGWWIVNFHIKAGSMEDGVSFNMQLK